MHVACVGGGPGGLFSAILLRRRHIADRVTVFERNRADATFGFGVVFSDETLDNVAAADPMCFESIAREFRHWPDIDIYYRGRWINSTGHGFAGLARLRLLQILAERASDLGVEIRYETEVGDVASLAGYDVIVASDGANSGIRATHAESFRPAIEVGASKYVWFGTTRMFESFTFLFEETEHGVIQAHCYPYDDRMSTFIVEMDQDTWRRAGMDATDDRTWEPGETDQLAQELAEEVFAKHLEGHGLVGNNSRWLQFPTIANERWHHDNIVLLGDAAHTAHFSIGSGTKLAMEDAIDLAYALENHAEVPTALEAYEEERRPAVASTQRAAYTSRVWFESVRRYLGQDDEQFAFQLLTRSQRITYDNLRMRDQHFMGRVTDWFREHSDPALRPADPAAPPMFYPFRLRGMLLANRVGVSPMAQYCAVDGLPNDWHLVHVGSRAVGGAGLVITEMTCVSPEGRITPGCTGLWNEAQQAAWGRIVDFVHGNSDAKLALQIGHSGRKGSTKVPWEAGGDDTPLDHGNWPLVAPSPLPWKEHNQVPHAMTVADMERIRGEFVRTAMLGAEAGFDMLELHMAHGYLLSSFLSPLTNHRTDDYGGPLVNRMRWPLEVFDAVREVWPEDRPMSVRISAVDWVEGGHTGDEAVAIAEAFHEHGCDIIDVSTGQVHPDQAPRYGRLYQTPYSDRIRLETGIPTMTVGGVASVDDVNTILVAGRADICLMARPHLVDPYWTLNAAIDQGYPAHRWPNQYLSGQAARRREQDPTATVRSE